jgi:hypothetical protein
MTAKNCLSLCMRVALCALMAVTFAIAQSDEQRSLTTVPAAAPGSVTSTPIPATMFDMSTHNDVLFGTPWPTMPIYGLRLWDTGTGWGQINTASGIYDWTTLDSWIAAAGTHNDQLIFTFGMTPTWASSKPTDASCDYGVGFCDPPNDLKTDGTGTDQHFINFVTAIAKHAPSITYWEMWNTPHDIAQWTGTNAQLVRMVKDANTYIKKYIPGAKIIAPANGQLNYTYPASNCTMPDKMGGYLASGLGKYIDIMALHTYYTTAPEDIVPVVQCYQSTMATYKVSSLPLWSTEGAWGFDSDLPGASDQAGFVARLYLLLWSNGVVRHYWYNWDDENTGTLSNNGVPNSIATAYQQVESWMSGRTMSTLCAENTSGIWTCGFTGSSGYAAQAVWYPGGSASYTAPSSYINYLDLGGATHSITSGATITVGVEPILLQNQVGNSGTSDFAFSEQSPFPEVTVGTAGTTGSITISAEDGFTGTVNLSCPATFGASSCSISPASVSTFPATATLTVNGTSFSAGAYQLGLQGTSGTLTHSFNVAFNVGDFSLTGPASLSSAPSSQATANLSVTSMYSYSGQVNATCNAASLVGAQCTLSPANPVTVGSGASVPVTATVVVPAAAVSGTYNITINTQDTNGAPEHSLTIPLTVSTGGSVTFGFGSFNPASQTITSGSTATYNFSVVSVGGSFSNAVKLACSGAPSISTCSVSPSSVTPGAASASAVLTITTTASSAAARHTMAGSLLYTSLPIVPGLLLIAGRKRRRKISLALSLMTLFLLALLFTSCAGGTGTAGSNTKSGGSQIQGTPPGTYTVTVTGTSGTLPAQTGTVTLTISQ